VWVRTSGDPCVGESGASANNVHSLRGVPLRAPGKNWHHTVSGENEGDRMLRERGSISRLEMNAGEDGAWLGFGASTGEHISDYRLSQDRVDL
jgi:hypothetical protein